MRSAHGGWAPAGPEQVIQPPKCLLPAAEGGRSVDFVVMAVRLRTETRRGTPGCGGSVLPVPVLCQPGASAHRLPWSRLSGCHRPSPLRALRSTNPPCPTGPMRRPCRTCGRSTGPERGRADGTVLPHGHKRLGPTELIWEQQPPSSSVELGPARSTKRCASSRALYLLWRRGVDTVMWTRSRLSPRSEITWPRSIGAACTTSGQPKPSATAFRFPFVTQRLNSGQVQAWGRAPRAGVLTISRQAGPARWTVLAQRNVGTRQVFLRQPAAPRSRRATRSGRRLDERLPWSQRG